MIDRHIGPRLREGERDGLSNPGAAAGYQRTFARKFDPHPNPPFDSRRSS
jgi:hypothetical protein